MSLDTDMKIRSSNSSGLVRTVILFWISRDSLSIPNSSMYSLEFCKILELFFALDHDICISVHLPRKRTEYELTSTFASYNLITLSSSKVLSFNRWDVSDLVLLVEDQFVHDVEQRLDRLDAGVPVDAAFHCGWYKIFFISRHWLFDQALSGRLLDDSTSDKRSRSPSDSTSPLWVDSVLHASISWNLNADSRLVSIFTILGKGLSSLRVTCELPSRWVYVSDSSWFFSAYDIRILFQYAIPWTVWRSQIQYGRLIRAQTSWHQTHWPRFHHHKLLNCPSFLSSLWKDALLFNWKTMIAENIEKFMMLNN